MILQRHGINYVPANAGVFLFARITPLARTWEDEAYTIEKFREGGVLRSAGRGHHGPESEKRWARVGFAVEKSLMAMALERIHIVLSGEDFRFRGNNNPQ
jgi:hypothetical protein